MLTSSLSPELTVQELDILCEEETKEPFQLFPNTNLLGPDPAALTIGTHWVT